MFAPMRAVIRDPEGKVLLFGAATMVGVGTIAYHVLEGWSFVDSLYFSVVTLATVGYGDLTPTTVPAKLFTVGYITVGIGIVAAFASELTKFRKAERLGEVEQLGAGLPVAPAGDLPGDGTNPAANRQES
jgi:voltage-gated potassium channel Kch